MPDGRGFVGLVGFAELVFTDRPGGDQDLLDELVQDDALGDVRPDPFQAHALSLDHFGELSFPAGLGVLGLQPGLDLLGGRGDLGLRGRGEEQSFLGDLAGGVAEDPFPASRIEGLELIRPGPHRVEEHLENVVRRDDEGSRLDEDGVLVRFEGGKLGRHLLAQEISRRSDNGLARRGRFRGTRGGSEGDRGENDQGFLHGRLLYVRTRTHSRAYFQGDVYNFQGRPGRRALSALGKIGTPSRFDRK